MNLLRTQQYLLTLTAMLLLGCTQLPEEETEPWFQDVRVTSGVEFNFVSGYLERPLLPEIVGGGVAIADFNGDSLLDLYFVQAGFNLDSKQPIHGSDIPPNELYLNEGEMRFERKTDIGAAADTGYGMGAYAGDYDNDGDLDLYVTNLGKNKLLENDGTGFFTDLTDSAGVGDSSWSTAASFVDFDVDGNLDLFVSNYISWSPETELSCFSKGQLTYCLPTSYQAEAQDRVYRNNGDGTFDDVSSSAGLLAAYGPGLGIVTADFDQEKGIDVFVANDTMVNQLWLQQADFQFENSANLWGSAVDDHGFPKAGMGIDTADFDHDGDFDVVVVNFEGQTDSFHRNEGSYFLDTTSRLGLGIGSRRFTRFGVLLADFDNDGAVDMYQANGKVDGVSASDEDPFAEPNMLFQGDAEGDGFRFVEVEPEGGVSPALIHTSRSAALADLDNDGGLDIVVVNKDSNVYILRNVIHSENSWLRVRPELELSQPAIGAVVSIFHGEQRQTGLAKTSGSYLSSNDPSVHFGLGRLDTVDNVEIRWLDGLVENFGSYDANQELVLIRGRGVGKEENDQSIE